MTAFTGDEQLYSDLDWYAIDRDGRIGQFLTAGHRLLPPSFASNKEMSEKLSEYFESLPFENDNFVICPYFRKNARVFGNMRDEMFEDVIKAVDTAAHFGKRMASRGLFSYDSNTMTHSDYKTYFRFAIPRKELRFGDLPADIKNILEDLRMPEVSFVEDSLIPAEITDKF